MQTPIINVNGQILKPEEAKISVFDRSYLYGDSLYEVARTYDGKFFGLEDHLERLEKSAALCKMVLGQPLSRYRDEALRTLAHYHSVNGRSQEIYCRIVVSRGEGKIGFGLACLKTPTLFTLYLQPVDEPGPDFIARGLNLQISKRLRNDPRALDPAMKSGNYLNSLLAFLDAESAGFDDALLCNSQGFLTEGTTFNIFYIRNGIVATPPLDIGILDGITRRYLLALLAKKNIPYREVRFPRERLLEADEVFMTSSTKEVFPVTKIDGRPVGSGKAGRMTLALREDFHEEIIRIVSGGERRSAWGHS